MTIRQPPRIVGRLLKCLVPAQDQDVLLGDLNEEFQRGRSFVWYWVQILAAIALGSRKDLRTHPMVAALAVVTGLIARESLVVAIMTIRLTYSNHNVLHAVFWGGLWWTGLLSSYASRPWTTLVIIEAVGDVAIGWLIVRLHRGHGVTMVLLCCSVFARSASRASCESPFSDGGAHQAFSISLIGS